MHGGRVRGMAASMALAVIPLASGVEALADGSTVSGVVNGPVAVGSGSSVSGWVWGPVEAGSGSSISGVVNGPVCVGPGSSVSGVIMGGVDCARVRPVIAPIAVVVPAVGGVANTGGAAR